MSDDIYGRPIEMLASRMCAALMYNMIDDQWERARRLYNIGVRGVWDRTSVKNLIINGTP